MRIDVFRKLIGDQADHQVGPLLEVLLGNLVAQCSAAVCLHEFAEGGGELLVLGEDDFGGCPLDEASPQGGSLGGELDERSEGTARLSGLPGQSGKQTKGLRLVEAELSAGEGQLGEGDRD